MQKERIDREGEREREMQKERKEREGERGRGLGLEMARHS